MNLEDFEALSCRDLMEQHYAQAYLGILLQKRELALLLGAGTSAAAGLPDWDSLVANCERAIGITPVAGRSSQELMKAIDTVRRQLARAADDRELLDIIRVNLYPDDYLASAEYPSEILQNPMLIAIGALVMASSRGSVGDVFTLNFDDLLEWYLHLHGFSTQVVGDFPTYLSGEVDVTVFHPHGFIPLVSQVYDRTDWLVLSHSELVERLAAGADAPWPTLLGSRFLSKRFLAIGTSMNDLDIDVHLARARQAVGGYGPIGFVVAAEIDSDRQEALLEVGMVPVVVGSHDKVPEFLLQVCRSAAN